MEDPGVTKIRKGCHYVTSIDSWSSGLLQKKRFFFEVSKDLGVFWWTMIFIVTICFGFAWETEQIWMVSRFVATMAVALTFDPWHVSYDHQNVINQWFVSDEMWWQSIYVSLSLYIYISYISIIGSFCFYKHMMNHFWSGFTLMYRKWTFCTPLWSPIQFELLLYLVVYPTY